MERTNDWKKGRTIGFDGVFSQSNKVWSCESHIVRACGESRKKILFQLRFFLCACVCVLLLLLFIFWASIGCWSKVSGYHMHSHLHAIKLSITTVNIEIILCLPFELRRRRKMTWFRYPMLAFAHYPISSFISFVCSLSIDCLLHVVLVAKTTGSLPVSKPHIKIISNRLRIEPLIFTLQSVV